MKTLTDLQDALAAEQTVRNTADKRIAELKEQINALPQGLWKPKKGEGYFFIKSDGCLDHDLYNNHPIDNRRLSIGNCFPTREAAERHVAWLKVTQRLRELAGGFKPDWNDHSQAKFKLCFDHIVKKWESCIFYYCQNPGLIYFPTREAAQHAIDVLGDDLNVLLDD